MEAIAMHRSPATSREQEEMRLTTQAAPLRRPTLSPREREVLQWCAQGKTSWEISQILGITERTVNFHVYQAAEKLGTRGRRATCLSAYVLGLIKA